MTTKHGDIITGWNRFKNEKFLVMVSSLPSKSSLGADTVEAITIFDMSNLRLVNIDLLWITRNFGEINRNDFAEQYPEYLI